MTRPTNDPTVMECVLELLTENGFGAMAKCMEILMNEAMKHERSAFIGAGPYQRSEERHGYANGYKPVACKIGPTLIRSQVLHTRPH